MATRSIISKNIAESASTYIGVDGELILNTSTNTLKVSDGSTAGGVTLTTDGTGGGGSTGDIGFSGNRLKTSSSNADLELDANGTGSVVVMPPTFTIKDENFDGSPNIREFTNSHFMMYNTLNINDKPPASKGIVVDHYNDGYKVETVSGTTGSSHITNFEFDFTDLASDLNVTERKGTLRWNSGAGGSGQESVKMEYLPTTNAESNNRYYSFQKDGLYMGGTLANIYAFGGQSYIGFDYVRVDGIDVKDNIITTNSSNADLILRTSGTGEVVIDAGLKVNGVALGGPRRISYTTDTNSGGTSAGDGSHCGITDDTIIETVLITNHQGSTGSRFTLKASGGNLATSSAGKIVTVQCVSGSNVSCDFYTGGSYSGQTLGSNTIETFFWTGTDWKRLTG